MFLYFCRNVDKKDNIEYSCTAYSDGAGSATAFIILNVIGNCFSLTVV